MNWRWLLADFRMISQKSLFNLELYDQTQTCRQDILWDKSWEMLCVLNRDAAEWLYDDFKLNWRWLLADFRMISQKSLFNLELYNQTQTCRQDIHWEKGWEMLCVLNKAAAAGTHWRQPRFTSTVLTAFCEHFDAPVAQCTKTKNSDLDLLVFWKICDNKKSFWD